MRECYATTVPVFATATLRAAQAFGLTRGTKVSDPPAKNQSSDLERVTGALSRASRKNLMLSASIEAGALKAPVRIRNLSESGAMIDGGALPEVGTALILRRLELEIGAMTVWRTAGRCGVRFDGAAAVDEWVAGSRRSPRPADRGQARVDALQSAVRRGAPLPSSDVPASRIPLDFDELESRIAEELAYVGRMLDAVGDELTGNPIVLQRHGRALQNLDAARQILVHLSAIIGSKDRFAAVDAVTMHELVSRLVRR
jgi:hypothetical protein